MKIASVEVLPVGSEHFGANPLSDGRARFLTSSPRSSAARTMSRT